MKTVGVIGLGNMGSGLARNLLKNGFTVQGFDIDKGKLDTLAGEGMTSCGSPAEAGQGADAVYVMVMNGADAEKVIFSESDGLVTTMQPGTVIIFTATILTGQLLALHERLKGTGIEMIDSPVSGGFPGAQSGTLTMMAAADPDLLDRCQPVMEAVSATIHRVGTEVGEGQTVKAVLQSLIGGIFTATFEAAALAAKCGIPGEVIHKVVSTSSAGCGAASNALEKVIDRQFTDTGSHIATMYKDMTIAMDLARANGVPLHTAAAATQLFQAGITRYPEGDNWIVTKLVEDIVGAELHRDGARKIR